MLSAQTCWKVDKILGAVGIVGKYCTHTGRKIVTPNQVLSYHTFGFAHVLDDIGVGRAVVNGGTDFDERMGPLGT
jgi:hypothetical protein